MTGHIQQSKDEMTIDTAIKTWKHRTNKYIHKQLKSAGVICSLNKVIHRRVHQYAKLDKEALMTPEVSAALKGWKDTSPDRVQDWPIYAETMSKYNNFAKMPWEL